MPDDIAKAVASKVVLIHGDEDALRMRALRDLSAAVGIGPEDFDSESFNADERQIVEWLAAASTVPFMGERRTVLIRQLLRVGDPLKEAGLKAGVFKSLPDTARLILVADEEPGGEDKARRLKSISEAWAKLVKAEGGSVLDCNFDPRRITETLRSEAQRVGKTLTAQGANLLAEYVGGNLSVAIAELEKLALYTGERSQIKEQDILDVVSASREWKVFQMIDAAVAGNTAVALRELRVLLGGSRRADEAAQRNILPLLSRQFRLLWQARVCIEANVQPTSAPDSVASMLLKKPNLATENFARDRAMAGARKMTLSQIHACLQALCDADARLKGALPGYSANETLERLVLGIVDIVQGRAAA